MAEKKIIAVAGATGSQGGGLVRAILEDPNSGFAVRALTRDPRSEKARALAEKGAEVVEASIDDPESVARAFAGAHGAFCVTFFWDHTSPDRELAQARALATGAKSAGVRHVIWSTLEDTRKSVPLSDNRMPTLMGKYKVPHFDAKGESDQFFAGLPATYLLTSFYWDNLIMFGMGPKKGPVGKLVFTLPMGDKKLAGIAAEDIGRCALGIFRKGPDLVGKRIGIAGEHLTGAQMASGLSKALGQTVVYNSVTPEQYRKFGFPGAEDLGNMFQFYQDFEKEFSVSRDPAAARSLNPRLQTFAQWLEAGKGRIQIS